MKNLIFLMLSLIIFLHLSAQETKLDENTVIKEAGLSLILPNSEWSLEKKVEEGKMTQYFFMRSEIQNHLRQTSKPYILVIVSDASEYLNINQFSKEMQKEFDKFNLGIKRTLTRKDKDYPLKDINAIFIESTIELGTNQIFYMIHMINKEKKGIQIYLSMDENLYKEYGSELWTTIKSIREI